ncbi:dimethylarginine dimethylaminohydrolase family protein [Bacillus suaedae]|uniref:Amidinotransferase n=1 Tax=Halalkalibacter suaedae TaxID=2822140 RepID=A0A941AR33_9BACI|nr:arginine deiminase family protein [Bacillus suaedae]MBP3953577.1 amidinotransferase [Bacillus suaedae]
MNTFHKFLNEKMDLESFEDGKRITAVSTNHWGMTNSVGQIDKVVVHRPGAEIQELKKSVFEKKSNSLVLRDKNGRIKNYCQAAQPPNLERMQAQHDQLIKTLIKMGAQVIELQETSLEWTNRLFTRDIGMVIPGGMIVAQLALFLRRGETDMALKTFADLGIPIYGSIQGEGTMEGGSFLLLNERLALVGRSIRVNQEGIDQLRSILSQHSIELISVDLPATLIHLDEAITMVDIDKALVDPALLPFWLLEELQSKGIQLICLDSNDSSAINNCLTIAPGKVIFAESESKTFTKLEKFGIELHSVDVSEITKMGGGINCVTLPLIRADI